MHPYILAAKDTSKRGDPTLNGARILADDGRKVPIIHIDLGMLIPIEEIEESEIGCEDG